MKDHTSDIVIGSLDQQHLGVKVTSRNWTFLFLDVELIGQPMIQMVNHCIMSFFFSFSSHRVLYLPDTYFGPGTVDTIKCHLNAAESKVVVIWFVCVKIAVRRGH